MRRLFPILAIAVCSWTSNAEARAFRVSDIPNGARLSCLNCHDDLQGGTFNAFGSAARANLVPGTLPQEAHVNWASLCPGDADMDGDSNGAELGDPDCIWQAGNADPAGQTSNPGHGDADAVCGNGKLDVGEDCEGLEMTYTDCLELDAGIGDLVCKPDCSYDYSACSLPPGGKEPGEYHGDGCSVAGSRGTSTWAFALALAVVQSLRSRRRRASSRAAT